ncbi:MAG TPA: aminotransferase class I/II-fold pyridoxal phosphate-dependent enzyme [Acidobacteriota bacterium]|nr:aminotransferase class I/II-fold pyridoxal phosphate-dependent enzyme [Acidobacteriota bacterium]
MRFDGVHYLRWAKEHQGRARYSLTCSNMRPVTLTELGLGLDDVAIASGDPDGYEPLKAVVAEQFGVSPAEVFIGSGATGCNFVAFAAALDEAAGGPGHVLCETPGYTCLDDAVRPFGAAVETFARPYDSGFAIDCDDLRRRLRPDTRLVVVTNLHNPSGAALQPAELAELADIAAAHGCRILVDEVYRDFVAESASPTARRCGGRMISVTGLSKVYGLSGLRVGLLFADAAFVRRCYRIVDYLAGSNSVPGDAIAAAALRRRDWLVERARRIAAPALARVRAHVEADDLLEWAAPPAGIIAFPRIRRPLNTLVLADFLEREYDLGVTPGDLFGLPGHVRLGFGLASPEDLEEALQRFRDGIRAMPGE